MLQNITIFMIVGMLCAPVTLAEEEQQPWLDSLHDSVTGSVNSTAVWLDDFFADENFNIDELPNGGARISLGWEPRSRDIMEFETKIRVKFNLPNLENQVDIVFSDFDEDLERAPVKAAQNEVLSTQNRFNLALKWTHPQSKDSVWSHRIGVGRKAQPYARTRYAARGEFSESQRYRWEISGYFYSQEGLGSHFGVQLEQDLADFSVMRLDNNFFFRDETNDWLWQHNLYAMQQLSDSSALITGIYLEGLSQPNYRIEEYLISSRWRKNALREWLYFELEPFILWRRDESFSASYGIALRVEGFFGDY
ncbi:hypothetical protein [Planctobacterium marinum]|uniref:Uncharacterized protein n=1 Tax=Planctobacterium marinum TaxID=1631968 RepID=A0AA48KTV0_9ALTE|nr:hypothetical protein MACH26_40880 [Planctobacterium marinum]